MNDGNSARSNWPLLYYFKLYLIGKTFIYRINELESLGKYVWLLFSQNINYKNNITAIMNNIEQSFLR